MKQILKNLCKCSIIAIVAALTVTYSDSFCATNGGRVSNTATRAQNRVGPRASTKVSSGATQSKSTTTNATSEQAPAQETTPEPTPEPEKPIIVNNKSSKFDSALNDVGGTAAESDDDALMRKIREQRDALDAADAAKDESNRAPSVQKCDIGLRDCMTEKCGADFSKCANDSETVWGSKIDACRTKTTCTAHEYAVLAPEIHADRDMNVHMSFYRAVLNCGDQYNSCIFNICGADLSKCLSKKEGDAAIEKCASIAKDCKQQDSGLAARVMGAFGDIRQIASIKAKRDEERLYELRDKMRETCRLLGAMFDERTLDCVFTVNFFAGDSANTPTASKKLYAGDSFQCEPEWFGIDVTTFKENAYRLTRSQTSASSAALGAGVGTAAGLISSGALNRAIETQKAKKEYEKAQKELEGQEGKDCSATLRSTTHVKSAKYDANGNCVFTCRKGFKKTDDNLECIPTEEQAYKIICQEMRKGKASELFSKGTTDLMNIGLAGGLAFLDPNAAMVVVQGAGETASYKYQFNQSDMDACKSGGTLGGGSNGSGNANSGSNAGANAAQPGSNNQSSSGTPTAQNSTQQIINQGGLSQQQLLDIYQKTQFNNQFNSISNSIINNSGIKI